VDVMDVSREKQEKYDKYPIFRHASWNKLVRQALSLCTCYTTLK
jgi:hypothetical protein